MSDAYIGQIKMFGGNFAPQGWATTNGQLLSIADYDSLFNLIGTTYGGDGQSTFALPNLAGRTPMHWGTGAGLSTRTIGQPAGAVASTLPNAQTSNLPGGSGITIATGPIPTTMPYLVLNFIISLQGIFPT